MPILNCHTKDSYSCFFCSLTKKSTFSLMVLWRKYTLFRFKLKKYNTQSWNHAIFVWWSNLMTWWFDITQHKPSVSMIASQLCFYALFQNDASIFRHCNCYIQYREYIIEWLSNFWLDNFLDGPTCRPSSPVELTSKFQEKCPREVAVLCSFEAKVRASQFGKLTCLINKFFFY